MTKGLSARVEKVYKRVSSLVGRVVRVYRLAASLSGFSCRLSEYRQPAARLREMPKLWARTSEQVDRSEPQKQCLSGIWRPKNRARRKWEAFRLMARILGIMINLGKYPMEGGFGNLSLSYGAGLQVVILNR